MTEDEIEAYLASHVPADRPVEVAATVRVDAYVVIGRAVEEGIERGWNRVHKHTDEPGPEAIRSAIYDAVMGELCEVLRFHEEG